MCNGKLIYFIGIYFCGFEQPEVEVEEQKDGRATVPLLFPLLLLLFQPNKKK